MLGIYSKFADFKQFCEETRIRLGMHLIGCEFYTGNKEVDGWVVSTDTTGRPISIRGNRGYSRALKDIWLYLEDGLEVPYGDYMEKFYPEYWHVWKYQINREDRIKYDYLEKNKEELKP